MSTRANIVLKEGNQKLFFYRHSDGYPAGTMPTLNIFLKWLKNDIRPNLQQGSGWLIMLGAMEYNTIPKFDLLKAWRENAKQYGDIETIESPKDWKVGAYEPTDCLHGDIEFLYTIDLLTKEIKVQEVDFNYETKKQTFKTITPKELLTA